MLLAEALIAAEGYAEAATLLERIILDHEHAPDYVRRRDRKTVARARRLRQDIERASARPASRATEG
jgi:hypothetical protein